jgi:hypothetical protein
LADDDRGAESDADVETKQQDDNAATDTEAEQQRDTDAEEATDREDHARGDGQDDSGGGDKVEHTDDESKAADERKTTDAAAASDVETDAENDAGRAVDAIEESHDRVNVAAMSDFQEDEVKQRREAEDGGFDSEAETKPEPTAGLVS